MPFIWNFTTRRTNLHSLISGMHNRPTVCIPWQEIRFLVNKGNMSLTHSPLHQSVYQLLCEGFHPSNNGVHPQIPKSDQSILCNTWDCCRIIQWLKAPGSKLTMREFSIILKILKNKLETSTCSSWATRYSYNRNTKGCGRILHFSVDGNQQGSPQHYAHLWHISGYIMLASLCKILKSSFGDTT